MSACDAHGPPRIRAGDAGFVYVAIDVADAGGAMPDVPSSRPGLRVLAGRQGARGDLDGVGPAARLGLVGGMTRVADAIVFADEGNGSVRSFDPATLSVETLARLPRPPGGEPPLPAFVAYDGMGRVVVSDRASSVLYSLDLSDRRLTLMGGTPGHRGDADGPLADALFDTPTGLAFDGAHTLYVADVGGRSLRRVDLDRGVVTTVARGFLQIWGLCAMGGTLYATDNLASTVVEVDTRTGTYSPIAGSDRFGYAGSRDGVGAAAHFREPRGIGCGSGTIYVADRGNGLVRSVDPVTHEVHTLAGFHEKFGARDGVGDNARFDDAQSVLPWGESLYVGDTASLRVVGVHGGGTRTVAGTPESDESTDQGLPGEALRRPDGVAFVPGEDAAYVADCLTSSVRRVDLRSGGASIFAGDVLLQGFVDGPWSTARFGCVSAIAYDGHGNLFVGDRDNHAIRDISLTSRHVITLAGDPGRCGNADGMLDAATFCDPAGLAFADGVLFVADAATSTIRRVDPKLETVATIAGKAFASGWIDGAGGAARLNDPSALVFWDGTLFVADTENHVVRTVDPRSGIVGTLAGSPGKPGDADGPFPLTRFDSPRALATVGPDDLLVFDRRAVHRLSLSNRTSTRLMQAGRGLRVGSLAPELSEPVAAAGLGPGSTLVVDRRENVLLELSYPP